MLDRHDISVGVTKQLLHCEAWPLEQLLDEVLIAGAPVEVIDDYFVDDVGDLVSHRLEPLEVRAETLVVLPLHRLQVLGLGRFVGERAEVGDELGAKAIPAVDAIVGEVAQPLERVNPHHDRDVRYHDVLVGSSHPGHGLIQREQNCGIQLGLVFANVGDFEVWRPFDRAESFREGSYTIGGGCVSVARVTGGLASIVHLLWTMLWGSMAIALRSVANPIVD